jgi:RHS repeat-associated protein
MACITSTARTKTLEIQFCARWLSRDPISYQGGINLYAYVRNDPLNSTDDFGMQEPVPIFPDPIPIPEPNPPIFPGPVPGNPSPRDFLYSCEPSVELTYYTSGGSGDAGDQYTGLDRFGRVVDQRWRKTSDNTDRERLKYGYDRASNRKWRQNTVASTGQDEYYTYDGLYQVKALQRGTLTGSPPTGISGTPSWEEDWNYDPLGNWNGTSSAYLTKVTGSTTLNQNRTHSVANEITGISTTTGTSWPTPVHNLVGNMTNTPQPLSLGSSYDLVWDAWNRLVQVTSSGSFAARYAYDAANRRISKTTGTQFRHYYYSDQWQVIEERTGNNANADRRFFWGVRGIDDLICRDRGPLERLYALSDGLNITAVVDVNGFVQERYGFDGFGGVRYMDATFNSRSSSNYDWETLFGGYRYDKETGLYQVRYRYLHSKLGRWLSRDPVGYANGTNLYSFVSNRPLTLIDSSGLAATASSANITGPTAAIVSYIADFNASSELEAVVEKYEQATGKVLSEGRSQALAVALDQL